MSEEQGSAPRPGQPAGVPGPWPWYALVVAGLSLSAFFPWLMLSWALHRRGKKRAAALSLVVNLALLGLIGWGAMRAPVAWWWTLSFIHVFDLAWSLAAWVLQRRILGPAAQRYEAREWRSWVSPVLVAVTLGLCVSVLFSLGAAFQERNAMRAAADALDRRTVLWGALRYVAAGLGLGILLGLWWAGERQRFRASHVISYLAGGGVALAGWLLFVLLWQFIAHRGASLTETLGSSLPLIPPWTGGFRAQILAVKAYCDGVAFLVLAALFGAPTRIRDFARRALLIPVAFACSWPGFWAGSGGWDAVQDQIVHEMSSPDTGKRASAHARAEVLLRRFPDQALWPTLAERLARYSYEEGSYVRARAHYQELVDRHSGVNWCFWGVARARGALGSAGFGKPAREPQLEIPMVDYESYLTHNWMALLSVMRYWEGRDVPESQIKIRLRDLSQSEDGIQLGQLTTLAELDDAARSLGYDVLILPAEPRKLRALVSAGIPVIHQDHDAFDVVFGFDDSRAVVRAYSFRQLSHRLRQEARAEAKEVLAMAQEGGGESRDRLGRIRNEAYSEYSLAYWKGDAVALRGPLMGVVCPAKKSASVATALGTPLGDLRRASDGYLATLVGLSYFNHADPVRAVEWTRIGARSVSDPLPLYVAHLAELLWRSRDKSIRSRLRLEDQFPELARLLAFFRRPETVAFLETARLRFEADRERGVLPSDIVDAYLSMLDRSDPREAALMKGVMRRRVAVDPTLHRHWKSLADACESSRDIAGMVEALEGAVSSWPMDSESKLRLAYGNVLLGRHAEAKGILEKIDLEKVRYEADYPFCTAAVAEWQGDARKASREYERAIGMRAHRPVYHLRLGALLLKTGQKARARRALEWAAKIDAQGDVRAESARLLASLEGE